MAYVNTETLDIVDAGQIIRANPDTSFPNMAWTDELLAPFGFAELHRPSVHPFPGENQVLEDGTPFLDSSDGRWYLPWVVRDLTPEEIDQRLEQKHQSMNVTPFQAKAALLDAGLLDDIEALMADPSTDRVVVLAWNNVTEFRRLSPMVAGIAAALGWTDEQLDTLFEAAALKTA